MRDGKLTGDARRFVVAGLLNTGLTLVVFQTLLLVFPTAVAYAGSWLVGLVFVAVFYPNRVFVGGRRGWPDRILVASTYAAVFLAGLFLLSVLEERWSWPPTIAIFLVMGVTTVMNFLAARTILRRGR